MKNKKLNFIIFMLIPFWAFTQKIIVKKIASSDNGEHYSVNCIFINESEKPISLILPNYRSSQDKNPYYDFFEINVKPENAYQPMETPPRKYSVKAQNSDVLTVLPKSKKEFILQTSKIKNTRGYNPDNLVVKKIKIYYSPIKVENASEYLEEDIINIDFYDKPITSK